MLALVIFGILITTKQPFYLFIGYSLGASLMALGGVTEIFFDVNAETQKGRNCRALKGFNGVIKKETRP